MTVAELRVWADGSGVPDGPGGVGWVAATGDEGLPYAEGSLPLARATNQQAEILAAAYALHCLPEGQDVVLVSDSQYVVRGCSEWIVGWVARGWRTSGGKPVKNRRYWERLLEAVARHASVRFEWTRGHAGTPENERADELAGEARRRALEGLCRRARRGGPPEGARGPVTAADVKAALRRRHPAIASLGGPGPWTCVEEWRGIDFLAFAAWTQPKPARCRHARVGYEVKVSRADFKRDLARPGKRAGAAAFCHEFYFAVPAGLLHPDEVSFREPWEPTLESPFERQRCPGAWGTYCTGGRAKFGTVDRRRSAERRLYGKHVVDYSRAYGAECPTCRGLGWVRDSRAQLAGAPKLWIPQDAGLVEVSERGVTVARKAPLNRDPSPLLDSHLTDLVRWVSVRPDPRHAELRR